MRRASSTAMRIPRRLILGPGSAFHLLWRGHNREWVLGTPRAKETYLAFLSRAAVNRGAARIRFFSYCLMSNHPHITGQIDIAEPNCFALSKIFQSANARFGRWYNQLRQRSGKVAEERFKTLRIEDDKSLQRVMLYSDANPVRAGIVKHPRDYRWSSYRYYALGERSVHTQLLDEPGWYLQLGRTAALRRRAYRRLMDAYLRSAGLLRDGTMTRGNFIGEDRCVAKRQAELREAVRLLRLTLSAVNPP